MDHKDVSKLFHLVSKNYEMTGIQEKQNIVAPKEWTIIHYKTYPRLPKLKLSSSAVPADLFDVLRSRQSRRPSGIAPITRDALSTLLLTACGETSEMEPGKPRRSYPSGGALFPIEIYPVVLRSDDDLKTGVYHYNPERHELDVLLHRTFTQEEIDRMFALPNVRDASVLIAMTAIFWRTQNKYGARGYRHILLEAGHIGQNIYLVSEALGIKTTAVGGVYDQVIERLLDVDGIEESLVYAFVLGA